ncbi:MAG: hypothetical protein ACK46H_04300, partial [Bacteroidota bacterium]
MIPLSLRMAMAVMSWLCVMLDLCAQESINQSHNLDFNTHYFFKFDSDSPKQLANANSYFLPQSNGTIEFNQTGFNWFPLQHGTLKTNGFGVHFINTSPSPEIETTTATKHYFT